MIGVAVEGISDRGFWSKLLHREFQGSLFRVGKMGSRDKLIRKAPMLHDAYRKAKYTGGLFIIDLDKNPCVEELRDLFDEETRKELKKPLAERFLHLGVANRKIESWYLADFEAVQAVIPSADYDLADYSCNWGKKKLGELWSAEHGRNATFNAEDFGLRIASVFSVERARKVSPSLHVAWERIENLVRLSRKE